LQPPTEVYDATVSKCLMQGAYFDCPAAQNKVFKLGIAKNSKYLRYEETETTGYLPYGYEN
jgi:hypothetical protein